MPKPIAFRTDETTREVLDLAGERFTDHPGSLDHFQFAVTHEEAVRVRRHFLAECLPRFGDYQDAMLTGEPFLYHSLLSPYIIIGLLDPLDLCREAEKKYADGDAPLTAVEGFIRQIIGRREYVRGIYWRDGTDYAARNFLEAKRDLPGFYYSGKTDLHCLFQATGHAYDHRDIYAASPALMHARPVSGYANACEWVELPNTAGMSQFADGGLMASKPYAASGNHINKMSGYCSYCRYDVKTKTGRTPARSTRSIGIFWRAMQTPLETIAVSPSPTGHGTKRRRAKRSRSAIAPAAFWKPSTRRLPKAKNCGTRYSRQEKNRSWTCSF